MLILNVFMVTGIYREWDIGEGTCSPAVCKTSHPNEANVCAIGSISLVILALQLAKLSRLISTIYNKQIYEVTSLYGKVGENATMLG